MNVSLYLIFLRVYVCTYLILDDRCTHHSISFSWMDLGVPHLGIIQSAIQPPDNWSPLDPITPLWDLCVSAMANSYPSPALLRFTLMFNPILAMSSFSPRSCSASHEYPKVCLLDRIIPPFKATEDNSSATKKHTQWIFCSLALFLSFSSLILSLPSVFVPLGFY